MVKIQTILLKLQKPRKILLNHTEGKNEGNQDNLM